MNTCDVLNSWCLPPRLRARSFGEMSTSSIPRIATAGCSDTKSRLSRSQTIGGRVSLVHFWIDYKRMLSGDFGDFASFVAHMKDIAKVIRRY